jgi:class 3 adenylate cyclase/streptogramin lyase
MQRRTGGRGMGAVLFTDIVGSTPIAAEMGNTRWGELVARHHRILRALIHRFGGREVDTAGDGFFVAFERPADAIRCAVEATEAVRGLGIEIRAGISFGELEMVGRKPGGLVVNTAARVMSVAGPGEVLVPASVREIVPGAGFTFAEHGVHQLKGLDGEFRLFGVTGVDGHEVVPPLEAEEAAERRREIFPTGGRRWALLVGVGAGVLALIVGAWILFSGGAKTPKGSGPPRFSVAMIDPETGGVLSRIPVESRSIVNIDFLDHPMAAGEGGVWLLQAPLLLHLDPLHEEVRPDPIHVGIGPSSSVVTASDAVWVITGDTLYRVNPATDEADVFLRLPEPSGLTTYSLAIADSIWVGQSDGTLVRLDPRTGARDQADTGLALDKLAATKDGVWLADVVSGVVVRVDPVTLKQVGKPIEVGGTIDQIFARGDFLWVLDRAAGVVTRIDTSSGTVGRPARVGDAPTDMAVGPDAVWVGDSDGSLFRVDPLTLGVKELSVGAGVLGVGVEESSGSVWVYLDKTVPPAGG